MADKDTLSMFDCDEDAKFSFRNDLIYNELAFSFLWKRQKSYKRKMGYILLPFVLIILLGVVIYCFGAYKTPTNYDNEQRFYSFFQDYSNCFMTCYVFFFMYYVNGFFVYYFNKKTDRFIGQIADETTENKARKTLANVSTTISIICFVFLVLGVIFVICTRLFSNQQQYWYSRIPPIFFSLYAFIVSLEWFLSFRLFVFILTNAITIYKVLTTKTSYASKEIQFKVHQPLLRCLAASLGFGIYFLIAIGMVYYSDYRANKYFKLKLLVYRIRWPLLIFIVLLSVFYFATIILCYYYVTKHIELQQSSGQIQDKQKRSHSTSFIVFLLTVLFPGIAAFLQLITPFWKLWE